MRWIPLIALLLALTALYVMALPSLLAWAGRPLAPAVSTINGETMP